MYFFCMHYIFFLITGFEYCTLQKISFIHILKEGPKCKFLRIELYIFFITFFEFCFYIFTTQKILPIYILEEGPKCVFFGFE